MDIDEVEHDETSFPSGNPTALYNYLKTLNLREFLQSRPEIDSESILLFMQAMRSTRRRNRLERFQSYENAVSLIKNAQRILIVTGAGISVSCGIPDFRSKGGFYDTLRQNGISKPESIFDIEFFRQDPSLFYTYGLGVIPSNGHPSPTHHFIAKLDRDGKLLRNYTQNIDNLEQTAGVKSLVQCHGSLGSAVCLSCGEVVNIDKLKPYLEQQAIAYCPHCLDQNIFSPYKPNIVFFGEDLPQVYYDTLREDLPHCDLVIVMGSSLKVQPVCDIIEDVDPTIPQILINNEMVGPHRNHFDINLIGACDDICQELQQSLTFDDPPHLYSHALYDTNITQITPYGQPTTDVVFNFSRQRSSNTDYDFESETDFEDDYVDVQPTNAFVLPEPLPFFHSSIYIENKTRTSHG
ncbi:putative NAD-dependent protein deacetylase sirtuin-1 [Blattamonas nauphoetae]|uniref:NAD-dependent protein deacetylase sirtuin-1 n=1 Tax=Blattamonas nauphoetae TaxID=2049346 RepID=A0ABQ9Y4Y2_9EUKA|nr:putative NAD-dependent protein deacetylase sirtuin-1 [Blattamonas nauphoetae]